MERLSSATSPFRTPSSHPTPAADQRERHRHSRLWSFPFQTPASHFSSSSTSVVSHPRSSRFTGRRFQQWMDDLFKTHGEVPFVSVMDIALEEEEEEEEEGWELPSTTATVRVEKPLEREHTIREGNDEGMKRHVSGVARGEMSLRKDATAEGTPSFPSTSPSLPVYDSSLTRDRREVRAATGGIPPPAMPCPPDPLRWSKSSDRHHSARQEQVACLTSTLEKMNSVEEMVHFYGLPYSRYGLPLESPESFFFPSHSHPIPPSSPLCTAEDLYQELNDQLREVLRSVIESDESRHQNEVMIGSGLAM